MGLSSTLRWLGPALLPAILFAVLVWRSDKNREPPRLVVLTFVLGALLGVATGLGERAFLVVDSLEDTSLGTRSQSLFLLFATIAPLREASKVLACLPAYRSDHFDEPYDGVVYGAASALGFAAVHNGMLLRDHTDGSLWIWRTVLALPAHVFFASAWGYALGWVKRRSRGLLIFGLTWAASTFGHALYTNFVFGRGPLSMIVVAPMLATMVLLSYLGQRSLRARDDEPESFELFPASSRNATDLSTRIQWIERALSRRERPVSVAWILVGAFVTMGSMIVALSVTVFLAHRLGIDFSAIDERDLKTVRPMLFLLVGLLSSFPCAGYLIARAAGVGLIEPALSAALALLVTLLTLGLAAPTALLVALAFSPVAWLLTCVGAWVGRPDEV